MRAIFYDGVRAEAQAVILEPLADRSGFRIISEHQKCIWYFAQMQLEETPSKTALGRFSCRSMPHAQLLMDRAVYELLKPPVRTARISHMQFVRILLFIAIMGVSIFLLFPMSVPLLARHFPQGLEEKIGTMVASELIAPEDLCMNRTITASLAGITNALAHESLTSPVKTYLMRHTEANAFALPGGVIVVHSQLIAEAESPEELAGILAHELGHVYHRHGIQNLIYQLGVTGMIDIVTGGGGTFTTAGILLINQRYSREMEREADAFAAEQMTRNHYALAGMAAFFARINEEETIAADASPEEKKDEEKEEASTLDAALGTIVSLISTHPVNEERVAFFKNYSPSASPKAVMPQAEWETLKAMQGCWPESKPLPKVPPAPQK